MTHSDDSQDAAASGQHAAMSQALSLTQVLECCLCCKLSNDTRVYAPLPSSPLVPQYVYQPLCPKEMKSANNKVKIFRMARECKALEMQHSTHLPQQQTLWFSDLVSTHFARTWAYGAK